MKRFSLHTVVICCIGLCGAASAHAQPIQFNRDVRPILSDACFQCHGPDKAKRKAKLHFDTEEGARLAIVPGKLDESELVKRVTESDPSKRMPPASAAVTLTPKQIDTLKQWIKEGAKWEKHWSFIAPQRPKLPSVKDKDWPRNPIDHFVLARLEQEGLAPSPEADPVTLIRRMSLDLTGLPPTPLEVDAFAKAWKSAAAPQAAAEALADRLLASPRYGERMAQRWLDGAHYADTNGYQTDGERVMWRWRDWVIEAYNDNMPFDRFTIEQIAGDMLPNATLEQKIATGFNRNHRGNSEGGVIPEEYAVEYVVDRVDTTSTVWLGLAAGCARCHDHKYDPLSQKEFYQLFAYFNNVPERGKAIKYGNSPPYIKSPTREQAKKLQQLQTKRKQAQDAFAELQPEIDERQKRAERLDDAWIGSGGWTFSSHQCGHFSLDTLDAKANGGLKQLHGKPRLNAGRIGQAAYLDGASWLDAGDVGAFGFFDTFSMGAWIKPAGPNGGAILSRMVDTDRADGYTFAVINGKLHVQLVKRWLDDAIRVETVDSIAQDQWQHVFFTYDGSREAKGINVYINGRPAKVKVNLDDLNQNFNTMEPFRIGAGGGSRFRGSIDDVRLFADVIGPDDVAVVANVDSIRAIVKTQPNERTPAQRHKLRLYVLETLVPDNIRETYREMLRVAKEIEKYGATIPTTMVMEEMSPPRDTHILLRGEYDKKGVKVAPGIPAALGTLPSAANNRLGFAKWLVSRQNPLTARVAVNRHWQMLFGAGLVRSVEDFGAQGDWPSHPELLDWLAVEFMNPSPVWGAQESKVTWWDIKHMLKLIVTSATYRQSSRVSPALLQRDPDNRLLARGPRFRLPADMIRDQALFASGLLVEKQGGPSVKPYQPAGLVMELTGTEEYVPDHGEKLYRRSLYTFWKRTVAPPTLMTFDAANRETCVVRETRADTPLQALDLMNDVTFVEAARVLAER